MDLWSTSLIGSGSFIDIKQKRIVDADEINKLVINQGVSSGRATLGKCGQGTHRIEGGRLNTAPPQSISQNELDSIITLKSEKFSLPLEGEDLVKINKLLGGPHTKIRKAGVYIFTHKTTGHKYVGSSNSLSRRLDQYFNITLFNKHNGLLMPLIKEEGLKAFNLEIIVMPDKWSSDYYFLFLEQYYLLDPSFNLNTQINS